MAPIIRGMPNDSTDCLRYALPYRDALTFPKQALVFTCLHCKTFENTVGKGEIVHNIVFYPFEELSSIFIKLEIVVCKLRHF